MTSLLLLFTLFFFCSPQLQGPPRAPDTHIVRHSSRHPAALETGSLGEERASSRKTPAQRSGDLKYPAAVPTSRVLCPMACLRPPELPCLSQVRSWLWSEAECTPSRLSPSRPHVNFPSPSILLKVIVTNCAFSTS